VTRNRTRAREVVRLETYASALRTRFIMPAPPPAGDPASARRPPARRSSTSSSAPHARRLGTAGPTLLFDAIRVCVRAHASSDRSPVARVGPFARDGRRQV
jgi:hypothetical protein